LTSSTENINKEISSEFMPLLTLSSSSFSTESTPNCNQEIQYLDETASKNSPFSNIPDDFMDEEVIPASHSL
jgi:hypothetical protein